MTGRQCSKIGNFEKSKKVVPSYFRNKLKMEIVKKISELLLTSEKYQVENADGQKMLNKRLSKTKSAWQQTRKIISLIIAILF